MVRAAGIRASLRLKARSELRLLGFAFMDYGGLGFRVVVWGV